MLGGLSGGEVDTEGVIHRAEAKDAGLGVREGRGEQGSYGTRLPGLRAVAIGELAQILHVAVDAGDASVVDVELVEKRV